MTMLYKNRSFAPYPAFFLRGYWSGAGKESFMETTKPRTVSSIGMFDMLKGAGMLAIVLGHTAELYPLQLSNGLSLTAFLVFVYRETLMAAFFIASG